MGCMLVVAALLVSPELSLGRGGGERGGHSFGGGFHGGFAGHGFSGARGIRRQRLFRLGDHSRFADRGFGGRGRAFRDRGFRDFDRASSALDIRLRRFAHFVYVHLGFL